MARPRSLALLIVLLGFVQATRAEAWQVEVFTDESHPVAHAEVLPGAVVYRIDALPRALEKASEGLPREQEKAAKIATRRLAAWDRKALQASAQGLARARLQYGLDRYPAIVFDGRYVIYGVTDLAVAKRIYEESGAPGRNTP
jgi:integrating conjugative element protein (TIGR03757 family)